MFIQISPVWFCLSGLLDQKGVQDDEEYFFK